jgi:hypothetical protein
MIGPPRRPAARAVTRRALDLDELVERVAGRSPRAVG